MAPWKRRFLLETIIFRCYVSFREGIHCVYIHTTVRTYYALTISLYRSPLADQNPRNVWCHLNSLHTHASTVSIACQRHILQQPVQTALFLLMVFFSSGCEQLSFRHLKMSPNWWTAESRISPGSVSWLWLSVDNPRFYRHGSCRWRATKNRPKKSSHYICTFYDSLRKWEVKTSCCQFDWNTRNTNEFYTPIIPYIRAHNRI